MSPSTRIKSLSSNSPSGRSLCLACPAYELNICQAMVAKDSAGHEAAASIKQSSHTAPARQVICQEEELIDSVPIICGGWAASVVVLSSNRRQILSFLLSGDVVSTTLVFRSPAYCLVETITDVQYRTFNRAALKSLLFRDSSLLDRLSRFWIEEKIRSDQLIVDLGRRTAEERVARLITGLMERLKHRGAIQTDRRMDFPLRQHQIADATGLTAVHVSKVLSDFRRKGLIEISDRELFIIDEVGFRRVATGLSEVVPGISE